MTTAEIASILLNPLSDDALAALPADERNQYLDAYRAAVAADFDAWDAEIDPEEFDFDDLDFDGHPAGWDRHWEPQYS